MPRIRQYADRYTSEDFWKEINRCCTLAGIQSDNAAALGRGIGVDGQNLRHYRNGKTVMPLDVLQKLVTTLRPNPAVILKTLGYSEKEIRAWLKGDCER